MDLVIEYHEELEVDLLRQGIDLLDLWRGALSFRRLALLIRHLPASSALIRSTDPDLALQGSWGTVEYLIRDLYNLIAELLPLVQKQQKTPYPTPAEIVELRRERERRDAFFAAQVERNRIRDAAEGRA